VLWKKRKRWIKLYIALDLKSKRVVAMKVNEERGRRLAR